VAFNDIRQSTGAGVTYCIPIFFGADDVTGSIAGNTIAHNTGPGVQFCESILNLGRTYIAFNNIDRNGGDGISVTGDAGPNPPITGGPVIIGVNVLQHNQGAAVEALWVPGRPSGIVDAGFNFSLHNGAPCVGVTCVDGRPPTT
jgi:hypothetical protein